MLSSLSNFFAHVFAWFATSASEQKTEEQTVVTYDGFELGSFAIPALLLQTITAILDKYRQKKEQYISETIHGFEEELRGLRKERDSLKQQLQQASATQASTETKFQLERTNLSNQILEASQNEATLRASMLESEKESTRLRSSVAESSKEVQTLRNYLISADQERERLTAEISTLKSEQEEVNETVKGIYDTITSLTAQKQEAEEKFEIAKKEVEKISMDKAELLSLVKTHEMEILVLNKQLEYSRARVGTSSCATSSPTTSITSYSSRFTSSTHCSPINSANSSPVSTRSYTSSVHGSPVQTPPLQEITNSHLSRHKENISNSSPLLMKTLTAAFNESEEIPQSPTRKLRL